MKYSMVKQFYNGALDNIYNFFFKWVDFGKIMLEALWSFFEIWQAFFLIFWNFFMYFYYLLLFGIDRGAESGQAGYFSRRRRVRRSSAPGVKVSNIPNPVPAAYRVSSKASATVREAAATVAAPLRDGPAAAHAKKPIIKTILEFFASIGSGLKNLIVTPVKIVVNFFADRVRPVREKHHAAEPQQRSLINDYLKEYEEKRKAE